MRYLYENAAPLDADNIDEKQDHARERSSRDVDWTCPITCASLGPYSEVAAIRFTFTFTYSSVRVQFRAKARVGNLCGRV